MPHSFRSHRPHSAESNFPIYVPPESCLQDVRIPAVKLFKQRIHLASAAFSSNSSRAVPPGTRGISSFSSGFSSFRHPHRISREGFRISLNQIRRILPAGRARFRKGKYSRSMVLSDFGRDGISADYIVPAPSGEFCIRSLSSSRSYTREEYRLPRRDAESAVVHRQKQHADILRT